MLKDFKYFIYDGENFKEVEINDYESWLCNFSDDYLLPDYALDTGKILYSIESAYNGAVDLDEELLPFILFYHENQLIVSTEGIEDQGSDFWVMCFKTFEEMKVAQNNIIETLESKG